MKAAFVLGVIVFVIVFTTIFSVNTFGGSAVSWNPPYAFKPSDFWSALNAFFFTFFFSLLFFGVSAPLALGVEGAKFASLYSLGAMPLKEMALAVPEIVAAYSAMVLGQGIREDAEGKGGLKNRVGEALKYFAVAVALFALVAAWNFVL